MPVVQTRRAYEDATVTLQQMRFWVTLAWQDIKLRYRGSLIGPFWLTLSIGILVLGLGILYSQLLKQNARDYVPFIAIGIVFWNFLTVTLMDGCNAFVAAGGIIKQFKLPLLGHIVQVLLRNIIIFMHHVVIVLLVLVYFGTPVGLASLWAIPGLILFVINLSWMTIASSIACARFRDLTQIISSLLQVAFFLSPIIWEPKMLTEYRWLADLNPLYALIEIVRAPLLGRPMNPENWIIALAFTAAGLLTALYLFVRFRARIVYWV